MNRETREIVASACGERVEVVYASGFSVHGFEDPGFGGEGDSPGMYLFWTTTAIAFINNEQGTPLTSWGSLTRKGVFGFLKELRPQAILTEFVFLQIRFGDLIGRCLVANSNLDSHGNPG